MKKAYKARIFVYCVILCIFISFIYFYQDNHAFVESLKESERRCLSEQSSLKYQVKVVTEYKGRLERMLGDAQNAHKADKDKFKEVAERCLTMKQQSVLCQGQFDDLQSECKKIREKYNEEKEVSAKFRNKYLQEQMTNEELKKTVDTKCNGLEDLYTEMDNLKKENNRLQAKLKEKAQLESKSQLKPNFKSSTAMNAKQKLSTKTRDNVDNISKPGIPPGFPPVISVGDNVPNLILPRHNVKDNLKMKAVEVPKVDKDKGSLEVVAPIPQPQNHNNLEERQVAAPNHANKNAVHAEQDPEMHEDDDEVEDYGQLEQK